MSEITTDGKRLVDNWRAAQERLERSRREVNSAECELSNSASALSKWLMPKDAKPGEVFSVWYGDSLIQVTVSHDGRDPTLAIRERGRSLR